MAIIIEEEKQPINVTGIVMWVIIIGGLLLAAYYLFFKNPELIPIKTPAGMEEVKSLSNINLNPEKIIEGPEFTSLRTKAEPVRVDGFGKSNPFLGF